MPMNGRAFGPGGKGRPRERFLQLINDRKYQYNSEEKATGIRVTDGTCKKRDMTGIAPAHTGICLHMRIIPGHNALIRNDDILV